jgi:DsbC/DsbD-like thiol-disulfide interchange protein
MIPGPFAVLASLPIILLTAVVAQAQAPSGPVAGRRAGDDRPVVSARAMLAPRAGAPTPGALVTLSVWLDIQPGWHVYANPTGDKLSRPTTLAVAPEAPVKLIAIDYPPGERLDPAASPGSPLAYRGSVRIPLRLQLDRAAPAGNLELPIIVRFQACNDQLCLPPKSLTVPLTVRVEPPR